MCDAEADADYQHQMLILAMNGSFSSNYCLPIQLVIFDYVDLLWVQVGFGVLYALILVLGLAANCVTFHCLLRNRLMLGVNSYLLMSLSVTDLLIGFTSLPLTAVHIFSRRWLLGEYMCRYVPLVQGATCFVTSFSLMAIAVERYLLISRDRYKPRYRTYSLLVLAIWLASFGAALPYAMTMRLQRACMSGQSGCFCGYFCDECRWPSEIARSLYGSSVFALQFVLPTAVLAFCYQKIRLRVTQSVRTRLMHEHVSLVSRQRLRRRKTRMDAVTLLLLAGFVGPWLPMNLLNLLRDWGLIADSLVAVSFAACHLAAMTMILWNPVVYCWANKQFRQAFNAALFCLTSSRSNVSDLDYEDDFGPTHGLATALTGSCQPSSRLRRTETPRSEARSHLSASTLASRRPTASSCHRGPSQF